MLQVRSPVYKIKFACASNGHYKAKALRCRLANTALGFLLNTVARLRPVAMALWSGSAFVQLLICAASVRMLLAG